MIDIREADPGADAQGDEEAKHVANPGRWAPSRELEARPGPERFARVYRADCETP